MKIYLTNALIAATVTALTSSPARAAEKNDWTLKFPETKAHFVKVQLEWAKKEEYWNPTEEELEARFDKLDADGDGQLTEDEWNNRDGRKARKKNRD